MYYGCSVGNSLRAKFSTFVRFSYAGVKMARRGEKKRRKLGEIILIRPCKRERKRKSIREGLERRDPRWMAKTMRKILEDNR